LSGPSPSSNKPSVVSSPLTSSPLTSGSNSSLSKTSSTSNLNVPKENSQPLSPSLGKKDNLRQQTPQQQQQQQQDDSFIPWKAKKAAVLQEFTTDETIGITVSFVEGADSSGKGKILKILKKILKMFV